MTGVESTVQTKAPQGGAIAANIGNVADGSDLRNAPTRERRIRMNEPTSYILTGQVGVSDMLEGLRASGLHDFDCLPQPGALFLIAFRDGSRRSHIGIVMRELHASGRLSGFKVRRRRT